MSILDKWTEKGQEELKRIKKQGKAAEDKVNEEAYRLQKKTGVPKFVWIGLAIFAVLIVLDKLGVI